MAGPNSTKIPPISVRGIRQKCPPGHVIGRLTEEGPAQFLPFNLLGQQLTKLFPGMNGKKLHDNLMFTATGPFTNGQQFTLAPANAAVHMPGSEASSAVAGIAPHGNCTMTLVSNLAAFLQNGSGVLATIAFTGGVSAGVITWTPQAIAVGQVLTIVMPAVADAALGLIRCDF